MSEQFDQGFWEERYRSKPVLWSGNPNRHLVEEAATLAPGTALDIGSGEGADAIWLAERGWRVTAVDFSTVALERAGGHAAEAGAEIAQRITWVHADLRSWEGPADRFDLVSSQYIHLRGVEREALFARMAAAVAPDGTLLIVGHHPSDMQTTMPRPQVPDLFFTGEDIAGALDPQEWSIVTNAVSGREAVDPDGNEVTIHDTVFRARRTLE